MPEPEAVSVPEPEAVRAPEFDAAIVGVGIKVGVGAPVGGVDVKIAEFIDSASLAFLITWPCCRPKKYAPIGKAISKKTINPAKNSFGSILTFGIPPAGCMGLGLEEMYVCEETGTWNLSIGRFSIILFYNILPKRTTPTTATT